MIPCETIFKFRNVFLYIFMLLMLPAGTAYGFNVWESNCDACHGNFQDDPYYSPSGDVWSASLHEIHSVNMGTDCMVCHNTDSPYDKPPLGASQKTAYNTSPGFGCSGCHGRTYGPRPYARGLRQHHRITASHTCSTSIACHSPVEPTAPESVDPPNYGGTLTLVDDACNNPPLYQEDFSGTATGLDNDGDNLTDWFDPDCMPTQTPTPTPTVTPTATYTPTGTWFSATPGITFTNTWPDEGTMTPTVPLTNTPTRTPAPPTWTPTFDLTRSPTMFTPPPTMTPPPDGDPPETRDCFANSVNPLSILQGTLAITITALVDDMGFGDNNIAGAEYFINVPGTDGTGVAMIPVTPPFNTPTEGVRATVNTGTWDTDSSPYTILIHGKDIYNNWGDFCAVQVNVVLETPTPSGSPAGTPTPTTSLRIPEGRTGYAGLLIIGFGIVILVLSRKLWSYF